jgi:transcriptional regulator with XRE-family HTH domain
MSGAWFTAAMNARQVEREAARVAERSARVFREDVDSLRRDAGISVPALAAAAGVDTAYLYRILAGEGAPSDRTRARLAVALGADLSLRLYPNTGPLVRDHIQARMAELLLRECDVRYRPFTEVRVLRPSRGWIDLVLHDRSAMLAVASELQSELRRLEQLIRWSAEKADSLPSWSGWNALGATPQISRLLVVRRTRTTRAVAADFAAQLRVAYPAHPDDALAALTTASAHWPGPAMLWVEVTAARTRFVPGR